MNMNMVMDRCTLSIMLEDASSTSIDLFFLGVAAEAEEENLGGLRRKKSLSFTIP